MYHEGTVMIQGSECALQMFVDVFPSLLTTSTETCEQPGTSPPPSLHLHTTVTPLRDGPELLEVELIEMKEQILIHNTTSTDTEPDRDQIEQIKSPLKETVQELKRDLQEDTETLKPALEECRA